MSWGPVTGTSSRKLPTSRLRALGPRFPPGPGTVPSLGPMGRERTCEESCAGIDPLNWGRTPLGPRGIGDGARGRPPAAYKFLGFFLVRRPRGTQETALPRSEPGGSRTSSRGSPADAARSGAGRSSGPSALFLGGRGF